MKILRQLALREAELTLSLAAIKSELNDIRHHTQIALQHAETENGTRQISVTLPDGRRVGTISLNDDTHKAEIVDENEFNGWIAVNFPTEIELKHIVRETFLKRALAEMTKANTPHILNTKTGELLKVPGVEIRTARTGTHTLRFRDDDAKEAVRATSTAHHPTHPRSASHTPR